MSNFATSDCFGLTITASVFKPPLQPQKPLISPPSYTPSSLQCPSPPPHIHRNPSSHPIFTPHCPCTALVPAPPPPPFPNSGAGYLLYTPPFPSSPHAHLLGLFTHHHPLPPFFASTCPSLLQLLLLLHVHIAVHLMA